MKYTIEGFSQEKLVELNLDLTDAVILRWFVDFKDSGKMYSEIIENDKYYWLKYDAVIEDLPILNIKKEALGRRFLKLKNAGILKHFTKKTGGTFSMYTTGEKYGYLVDSEFRGYDSKIVGGTTLESDGYDSKSVTKNPSTNNPSTNKSNQEEPDSDSENKFKTKPSVIKMLAYDRNMILDNKFIDSLTIYEFDFIKDLLDKVPKGTNNPTGYLVSCLKNNPQPKVEKIKKVEVKEPVQVIEEPKAKEPRNEIILNFCKESNCSEDNMPTFLKNILNKTLEGMNYDKIS